MSWQCWAYSSCGLYFFHRLSLVAHLYTCMHVNITHHWQVVLVHKWRGASFWCGFLKELAFVFYFNPYSTPCSNTLPRKTLCMYCRMPQVEGFPMCKDIEAKAGVQGLSYHTHKEVRHKRHLFVHKTLLVLTSISLILLPDACYPWSYMHTLEGASCSTNLWQ